MSTATVEKQKQLRTFGPDNNGILMSSTEFDRAKFADEWRYELLNGVLVVSPPPLPNERDPNGELEYLLRCHRDDRGIDLITLAEQTVRTGPNRRRADRAIWLNLGRLPLADDPPTIVVEFVSSGRRNLKRDYDTKREEYLAIGVREYWIIDRFAKTMTVHSQIKKRTSKVELAQDQAYSTDLMPGFSLPLNRLFGLADRWKEEPSSALPGMRKKKRGSA